MKIKVFAILSVLILFVTACGNNYQRGQIVTLQEGTKLSRTADLMPDSFTCALTEETAVRIHYIVEIMGETKVQVENTSDQNLPCPGLNLKLGYLLQ